MLLLSLKESIWNTKRRHLVFTCFYWLIVALADLRGGGHQGRAPSPLSPNFFNFMQFWGKIGKNNRLAPPPLQLAHLLLGNPGSATVWCWYSVLVLFIIADNSYQHDIIVFTMLVGLETACKKDNRSVKAHEYPNCDMWPKRKSRKQKTEEVLANLGGAKDACPPLGQIFFIFMPFWGKSDQIAGWRSLSGWGPFWEILDAPLMTSHALVGNHQQKIY